nr:Tn3 family transposase [Marinicella sp. W31]MDC2876480.1 Tn3 family transposase [Marinicella sp. W31]
MASLSVGLTGKRFAPRQRNIKDRKLHTFEKPEAYPSLANHIGAPINTALIMEHWEEFLRLPISSSSACFAGTELADAQGARPGFRQRRTAACQCSGNIHAQLLPVCRSRHGVGIVDRISLNAAGTGTISRPFEPDVEISYFAIRPSGARGIAVLDDLIESIRALMANTQAFA